MIGVDWFWAFRYILFTPLLVLLLTACDENVVYNKNINLEESIWNRQNALTFDFSVDNNTIPNNLYFKIRYNDNYPYYNFYIKYSLVDSLNNLLADSVYEMILFDPKRGDPLGSGSTMLHDLEVPIYQNNIFKTKGKYQMKVRQNMRMNSIEGIDYFGLKIEKSNIK